MLLSAAQGFGGMDVVESLLESRLYAKHGYEAKKKFYDPGRHLVLG